MTMRVRCVVCDKAVPNQYAPTPCCEGYTCPMESRRAAPLAKVRAALGGGDRGPAAVVAFLFVAFVFGLAVLA